MAIQIGAMHLDGLLDGHFKQLGITPPVAHYVGFLRQLGVIVLLDRLDLPLGQVQFPGHVTPGPAVLLALRGQQLPGRGDAEGRISVGQDAVHDLVVNRQSTPGRTGHE